MTHQEKNLGVYPAVQVSGNEFLPRSMFGRFVLFILATGAAAFSGMGLYANMTGREMGAQGKSWGEWLIRVGATEFFLALFITGCVGILWSIAAP